MNKGIVGIVVLSVVVFIGIVLFGSAPRTPEVSAYNDFAQCLADSGTTFYGAFWCPNCVNQKQIFASGADLLPYVECSTLDRRGQLEVCQAAGIEAYPTWEFPDGSRQTGTLGFEALAAGSGCAIPTPAEGTTIDAIVEEGATAAPSGDDTMEEPEHTSDDAMMEETMEEAETDKVEKTETE